MFKIGDKVISKKNSNEDTQFDGVGTITKHVPIANKRIPDKPALHYFHIEHKEGTAYYVPIRYLEFADPESMAKEAAEFASAWDDAAE